MADIEGVVCGASHLRIEDSHPVEWLRGKKTVEFACDELPDPLVIGGRYRIVAVTEPKAVA